MNNASFHLSTTSQVPLRHPLLPMPNHSAVDSPIARLLSSSNSSYNTANMQSPVNANNALTASSAQMSAMNFPNRDLLLASNQVHFPYFGAAFNGMPMISSGPFGMFPHYGPFFPKSPVPGFLNAYLMNKEDELLWQKRSPNNLPESPLSGVSRNSPGDINSSHKRFCRSRYADQNYCPVCGQSVSGITMQEHFLEELKSYRQHDVDTAESQTGTPTGNVKSVHARSLSATPTETDSRLDIFAKVRNNRKSRLPPAHDSRPRPAESTDLQRQTHSVSRHGRRSEVSERHSHTKEEAQEDDLLVVDVDNETAESQEHTAESDCSASESSLHTFRQYKRKIDSCEDNTEEQSNCSAQSSPKLPVHYENKVDSCSECQLDFPIAVLCQLRSCLRHWYCRTCCFEKNLIKEDRCIRCYPKSES